MLSIARIAGVGYQPVPLSVRRRMSRLDWDTSSRGFDADTSPMELEALHRHALDCARSNGRWFGAMRGFEALRAFATTRPIGTLIAIAVALWALTS